MHVYGSFAALVTYAALMCFWLGCIYCCLMDNMKFGQDEMFTLVPCLLSGPIYTLIYYLEAYGERAANMSCYIICRFIFRALENHLTSQP